MLIPSVFRPPQRFFCVQVEPVAKSPECPVLAQLHDRVLELVVLAISKKSPWLHRSQENVTCHAPKAPTAGVERRKCYTSIHIYTHNLSSCQERKHRPHPLHAPGRLVGGVRIEVQFPGLQYIYSGSATAVPHNVASLSSLLLSTI